ncbi:hypothetical protein KIN20_021169 [Parelaphostrongylus tenuis]|uniref:Uncharacterized protein n=1 Tax=Parelaphostrongylus tenuis TaxID=148309 RepID=A0AAD5MNJ8_PARTN|nr:hypothetical protein KIN20_021169 [Parelaphostrongylus tenuis]
MLSESLERGEPTGLFLHATGKDGGAAGALSGHSRINGATGDTGDRMIIRSEMERIAKWLEVLWDTHMSNGSSLHYLYSRYSQKVIGVYEESRWTLEVAD